MEKMEEEKKAEQKKKNRAVKYIIVNKCMTCS